MGNFVYGTNGQAITANRSFKPSPDYSAPLIFRVGMGTTSPSISDISLQNPIPYWSASTTKDSCDATTGWSITGGALVVNNVTFIEGTGSLDMSKTATNVYSSIITKSTLTAVNLTSDSFIVWMYIKDAATLAKLQVVFIDLGSDASNYYRWRAQTNQMFVGWNPIFDMIPADAYQTVGAPTIASLTYCKINVQAALITNTWPAGSILVDWIAQYTPSDLVATQTIDTTNLTVTATGTLPKTYAGANGQPISEFGLFNTDGTYPFQRLLFDRSTFTPINKTSAFQLNFEEQYVFNT